jgi:hypothetical protein
VTNTGSQPKHTCRIRADPGKRGAFARRGALPSAFHFQGVDKTREDKKVPKRHGSRRSQACKFLRDFVAVLHAFRIAIAEVVFTLAALYGAYHAFQLLVH